MESGGQRSVRLTERLVPDYYPEFNCTAEHCYDSCCGGWSIFLTKSDYMQLRQLCQNGLLVDRFKKGVRRIRGEKNSDKTYAQIQQQDYKCPFLADKGLCSLQIEFGIKALPNICKTFPRHTFFLPSGMVEHSCTPGCEEVLRLLYVRHNGLSFIQEPLPPQERQLVPAISMGPLTAHFEKIRELCIDILQDRTISLPDRMLLLGRALKDLEKTTHEELPDIITWVAQRRALSAAVEVRELIKRLTPNKQVFVLNNVRQLLALPKLYGNMEELRGECCSLLEVVLSETGTFQVNTDRYLMAEEAVKQTYGDLEYFFENIMVNVIFHGKYPLIGLTNNIFLNYVYLCNVYASLRFMMVCGCYGHSDLNRLFHVLTLTARSYLHNADVQKLLTNEFIKWESTGLGDMAILVRG